MTIRAFAAASLAVLTAACDIPDNDPLLYPTDAELEKMFATCDYETSCAIAKFTTATFANSAGVSLGDGLSVRGAKLVGKRSILDFNLPDDPELILISSKEKSEFEAEFAADIEDVFCDGDIFEEFIDDGGSLEINLYFASGKRFSRSILSKC